MGESESFQVHISIYCCGCETKLRSYFWESLELEMRGNNAFKGQAIQRAIVITPQYHNILAFDGFIAFTTAKMVLKC
jgi:hypothetical protein